MKLYAEDDAFYASKKVYLGEQRINHRRNLQANLTVDL